MTMRETKQKVRPTPARAFPSVPLSVVEPYFVGFTVLSGCISWAGAFPEDVPLMVLGSWAVMAGSRQPTFRLRTPLRMLPEILAAGGGMSLFLLLPMERGLRDLLLAVVSTGIPWLLLRREESPGWPSFWNLRAG